MLKSWKCPSCDRRLSFDDMLASSVVTEGIWSISATCPHCHYGIRFAKAGAWITTRRPTWPTRCPLCEQANYHSPSYKETHTDELESRAHEAEHLPAVQ